MELVLHQYQTVSFTTEGGWEAFHRVEKWIIENGGTFTNQHLASNTSGTHIATFPADVEVDMVAFQSALDEAEAIAVIKNKEHEESMEAGERFCKALDARMAADGIEKRPIYWSMDCLDLDSVAVKGKVRIVDPYTCWDEDGFDLVNKVFDKTLKNPTWYDIAVAFNEYLVAQGDTDHIFLEGFDKKKDGTWEFVTGS